MATIQWLLATVYHLHLSMGGITAVLHTVARQAAPTVTAIRDRIRASPVVHGDETGWRQDGVNGFVWTFSTPTARYFLRRGRRFQRPGAFSPAFPHHYWLYWYRLNSDVRSCAAFLKIDEEVTKWQ